MRACVCVCVRVGVCVELLNEPVVSDWMPYHRDKQVVVREVFEPMRFQVFPQHMQLCASGIINVCGFALRHRIHRLVLQKSVESLPIVQAQ